MPTPDKKPSARRVTPPTGSSPRTGARPFKKPVPPKKIEMGRGSRRIALPLGLSIVHEDRDIIVVDKPAGLLSVAAPGEKKKHSVFDTLKALARSRGGRDARVYVIHRLDQEASGLLVFAKSDRAFSVLKEDFRSRRVHRLYHALVEGVLLPDSPGEALGTIQSLIRELPDGSVESLPPASGSSHAPDEANGEIPRLAITHYRVLARGEKRTLAQVRLETGRKHQIRIHLASIGHPITGDPRYGKAGGPLGRLGLHATELGFRHPATGESVKFSSPAPSSFWKAAGADSPTDHGPRTVLAPTPTRAKASEGSWDHVAQWYDTLIDDRGSDLYSTVIMPGSLGLLAARPGERILDLACGQGVLARSLATIGAKVVGVDASPQLIEAARARSGPIDYAVGDARDLAPLGLKDFDAIACIMALMNIDPLESVIRGCANALKDGGRFVAVILHPAFRSPGQTRWGWDEGDAPPGSPRSRGGSHARQSREHVGLQFRRVDGYLTTGMRTIVMNPGEVAEGHEPIVTVTYHRPLQTYARILKDAGFLIDSIEEWPSSRTSKPGPRALEENRARREIPMFLALRAIKRTSSPA
ncbi:MAG: methyltransferase domain-containing protein [Phycisphaeraceae bacterium]|nr:methyltransferase domain-containing protein [Phycisphaeraceae bacterium]